MNEKDGGSTQTEGAQGKGRVLLVKKNGRTPAGYTRLEDVQYARGIEKLWGV